MNTARAFGPAAVSGFPNDSHWIVRRASIHIHYSPPVPVSRVFFYIFARSHAGNNQNLEFLSMEEGRNPLTHAFPPHALERLMKKAMLTPHVGQFHYSTGWAHF